MTARELFADELHVCIQYPDISFLIIMVELSTFRGVTANISPPQSKILGPKPKYVLGVSQALGPLESLPPQCGSERHATAQIVLIDMPETHEIAALAVKYSDDRSLLLVRSSTIVAISYLGIILFATQRLSGPSPRFTPFTDGNLSRITVIDSEFVYYIISSLTASDPRMKRDMSLNNVRYQSVLNHNGSSIRSCRAKIRHFKDPCQQDPASAKRDSGRYYWWYARDYNMLNIKQ
ncbi:hypothetical protein TNCV_2656821 [Trichonephila clavipes]|nr:hypothetical protein TNCV_2656821 [Trichonephila clavipes]